MRTILPPELASMRARDVRAVAAASSMTLAIGAGEIGGESAAAALFADLFAIVDSGSTLVAPASAGESSLIITTPSAWGGAVWRLGPAAYRLHLASRMRLTAKEAVAAGLADALVPAETDPVQWAADWIGARSELALESAAALIRRRGGDPTERFEFARLFAAGEPQRGLAAFLEKRRPKWNSHEPERN